MSIDSDGPPAPVLDPSAVLASYVARMRRQRLIYAIVLLVLTAMVVTLVEVVLQNGEAAHAHLHSAKAAVPPPTDITPSANQTLAWYSNDVTAIGNPVYDGTVITYSTHTVSGRNFATGAAVWTYTRTDVSICQVVQVNGITIAFYDLDGNCDEASAFNTGTGTRAWYRTLDSDTHTINGHPSYSVSQFTILISTPTQIEAIDPGGGLDRWHYAQPAGCTTTSAVIGSSGALIGQHCANGNHLLLRDPYVGDDDSDAAKAVKWSKSNTDAVPLSADDLISAFDPQSGSIVRYQSTDGAILSTEPLKPTPAVVGNVTAVVTTAGELIWISGTAYSIATQVGTVMWTAQVSGPPTVDNAPPIALTSAGVIELDATTGAVTMTYPLPASAAGGLSAYRVGTGFVVGGASTSVYH